MPLGLLLVCVWCILGLPCFAFGPLLVYIGLASGLLLLDYLWFAFGLTLVFFCLPLVCLRLPFGLLWVYPWFAFGLLLGYLWFALGLVLWLLLVCFWLTLG